MRFGLKRKKENEFSFYAPHPNQLLSEVLFTTAGLFLKNFANLRVLGGSALKYTALGSVCLVYFVVKNILLSSQKNLAFSAALHDYFQVPLAKILFPKNSAILGVLRASALKYTALGSVCLVCFVVKIYRPGYLEILNPKL